VAGRVEGGDHVGEVGYMGGASPWWGRAAPRDARLDRRCHGAPSPTCLPDPHFHSRGKFNLIITNI
jgi:hypothetical protein